MNLQIDMIEQETDRPCPGLETQNSFADKAGKAIQAIHNIVHGQGASLSIYAMLQEIYQNADVLDWVGENKWLADQQIVFQIQAYITANRAEIESFLRGDGPDMFVFHGN
ncbi:MAG: hypothetical protein AB7F19_07540 [Candidatus Babeliales bacterium]